MSQNEPFIRLTFEPLDGQAEGEFIDVRVLWLEATRPAFDASELGCVSRKIDWVYRCLYKVSGSYLTNQAPATTNGPSSVDFIKLSRDAVGTFVDTATGKRTFKSCVLYQWVNGVTVPICNAKDNSPYITDKSMACISDILEMQRYLVDLSVIAFEETKMASKTNVN
jgi:hypothetical protein